MNILIFDPWEEGRLSAKAQLRRRFDKVVCVGSLRDLVRKKLLVAPAKFGQALFVIPSIVVRGDGSVYPRSYRANEILEVTVTCSYLSIPHAIFSTGKNDFLAYYDRKTKREVSADIAFWRSMDIQTGTFRDCYVGRDWNAMLNIAEKFLRPDALFRA